MWLRLVVSPTEAGERINMEKNKDTPMLEVDEIKAAIESLPENDFIQLRRWLSEKDWEEWDKQIEADSEAGKLDFLVREAHDQKTKGRLKDL